MSSSNLPPWDLLSFTFRWDPVIATTIPQCYSVALDYGGAVNGRIVSPPPTPPYNLVLYSGGFEPWTISMNNSAATGRTQWLTNLPVGPIFAVSMKDSRGYSGGILSPAVQMTGGAGCGLTSSLKASSLSINITGSSSQCRDAIVTLNNGVPPYVLEVIPLDGRTQKTIRFAASPFRFTLDMSAGVKYWLAVYDSRGSSGVQGPYRVGFSLDDSCLGLATTVTAGKFSTMYSGGTAQPTDVANGESSASASAAMRPGIVAINMAVLIPLFSIAFAFMLLSLCFRRSSRHYRFDPHDQSRIGYSTGYLSELPHVPGEYMGSAVGSTSGQDSSNILDAKSSGSAPSRSLVNPDSHHLGPVEAEPFELRTLRNHTFTASDRSAV